MVTPFTLTSQATNLWQRSTWMVTWMLQCTLQVNCAKICLKTVILWSFVVHEVKAGLINIQSGPLPNEIYTKAKYIDGQPVHTIYKKKLEGAHWTYTLGAEQIVIFVQGTEIVGVNHYYGWEGRDLQGVNLMYLFYTQHVRTSTRCFYNSSLKFS